MADPLRRSDDEALLIDFLLGQCPPEDATLIAVRLQGEEEFRRLHQDLKNTFAAIKLLPEVEPPANLVTQTLQRVRAAQQTNALIAREESARPSSIPTFTFREMAVAAAALVLFGIVLLPAIRNARTGSQIAACAAQVGQIGTALGSYANANDGYLPAVEGKQAQWLPAEGKSAVSNSVALFKLINGRYASSPVVFQCPAIGGSSFQVTAGMTDFPAGKYVGYSYQHSIGKYRLRQNDPVLSTVAKEMAILADSSPLFDDGRFHRDRMNVLGSDNHRWAGQNVLYLDQHVAWSEKPDVGVNGDNIYNAQGVTDYAGNEVPASMTDTFLLPSYSPAGR